MTRATFLALASIAAGFLLASGGGALAARADPPSCHPSYRYCTRCIEYSGSRCTKCGHIPGCKRRTTKPSYEECVRGCLAKCGMRRDPKTGECKGSTQSH